MIARVSGSRRVARIEDLRWSVARMVGLVMHGGACVKGSSCASQRVRGSRCIIEHVWVIVHDVPHKSFNVLPPAKHLCECQVLWCGG